MLLFLFMLKFLSQAGLPVGDVVFTAATALCPTMGDFATWLGCDHPTTRTAGEDCVLCHHSRSEGQILLTPGSTWMQIRRKVDPG
jgi:hypothetical protein